MHRISLFLALAFLLFTQNAVGQSRHVGSHEHGKGTLNIAIEGKLIVIELEAPGADIVGFEHPAKNAADRDAIEKAKAVLRDSDRVFTIPSSAGCDLERAKVDLFSEEASDGSTENHTEFFATYQLGCADPDQASELRLPYFETFPNARQLLIQLISRKGSVRYDVDRKSPIANIRVRN